MTQRLMVGMGMAAAVVCAGVVFGQHINGVGVPTAGAQPTEMPRVQGEPLEKRPPRGKGQLPAFAGQTRAVAVVTKTPLDVKVVARGLANPWSLNFMPDGNILITEKPGVMRVVTQEGKVSEPI